MKCQNSEEQLYKAALSASITPGQRLNHTIKMKMEAQMEMKTKRHILLRPVLAAVLVVMLAGSALAAWVLLTPEDVALELNYPALAEAFKSPDAVMVNKTQSDDGFDITFLGIVSGSGLVEMGAEEERSYAVVAISRQDGVMPAISELDFDGTPFFVSGLIVGQKPWLYNIASMGGGYTNFVHEGVMYRLIECDSLEMFADRGLSLCVSSTTFYDVNAFTYDEGTGKVTPNPDFNGVNLLFDLPLDPVKGDTEKARQYLDTLWDDDGQNGALDDTAGDQADIVSSVMDYEQYKAWSEAKLAELRAMVDAGQISEETMALGRQDFEDNLREIEKGAILTLSEYLDRGYATSLSYPDSGFSVAGQGGEILIAN